MRAMASALDSVPSATRATTGFSGTSPERFGANGPEPSSTSFVSTIQPWRCAATESPPPTWATITFTSSYALPMLWAKRMAHSFWFRQCTWLLRYTPGYPVMRATSSSSSVSGWFTANAGLPVSCANLYRMGAPRMAGWFMPQFRTWSHTVWSIAKMPPRVGPMPPQ